MQIPLALNTIKAGFPSPADDFVENNLDLNEFLIHHPNSTFFVKVSGDSMINVGIHPGCILVVDKSAPYADRSIVVALVENEFTVKRLRLVKNNFYLFPENSKYKPIKLNQEDTIWGVVTAVINKLI